MDDNTDSVNGASQRASKKKRIRGACDICKRKKIRCDSGLVLGNRCTNCVQAGTECTHIDLSKNLSTSRSYTTKLEQRLQKMELLMNKLLPGVDLDKEADRIVAENANDLGSTVPRNDDENVMSALSIKLNTIELDPSSRRFYGKASEGYLIQTFLNERVNVAGVSQTYSSDSWAKRPEFWTVRPWQAHRIQLPWNQYSFPPDDLIPSLVDLYFQEVNLHLPALHRPTFERAVVDGLHFKDPMFAGTLLLVSALGSRYSSDPRVFLEGNNAPHTAGWKWFDQVPVLRTSLVRRATLYELQNHVLSIMYTQSTSMNLGDWVQVGIALRLAQDVGAHLRKTSDHPNTKDELWKRVFWCLVCLDRLLSGLSGKSITLQDDDFDLQYPLEVDDEYWDHPDPEQNFKQPEGKPAKITGFVLALKLMKIMGNALKSLYGLQKPDISPETPSIRQTIADLDSDTNRWLDTVPEHLRWDPARPADDIHFRASTYLHASFYFLQILTHRPFIPTPHAPSLLSLPSLTICTNAARSISRLIQAPGWQNFGLHAPLPHLQYMVFLSGVVLLLSTWSHRGSRLQSSINDELVHIHACLNHLKACEDRWNGAGCLWDILTALMVAGDRTNPEFNTPHQQNVRAWADIEAGLAEMASADRSIFMATDGPVNVSQPHPFSWSDSTASFPDETMAFDPLGANAAFDSMFSSEMDPTSMWSSAPSTFQLDAWGPYINSFNQMTHAPAVEPLERYDQL